MDSEIKWLMLSADNETHFNSEVWRREYVCVWIDEPPVVQVSERHDPNSFRFQMGVDFDSHEQINLPPTDPNVDALFQRIQVLHDVFERAMGAPQEQVCTTAMEVQTVANMSAERIDPRCYNATEIKQPAVQFRELRPHERFEKVHSAPIQATNLHHSKWLKVVEKENPAEIDRRVRAQFEEMKKV